MHRFFTEKENISDNFIVLQGSDVSHIRKVLRLKVGDQIEVLDGEGSLYLVNLADININSRKGEIERFMGASSAQRIRRDGSVIHAARIHE